MYNKEHLPALDGVRGIAVLLVIFHHVKVFSGLAGNSLADKVFGWVGKNGSIGVDLFFVLSGFLITGVLLSSKGTPHYFRNFYLRRTLRIFPLYYLYLVLIFFVASHFYLPLKLSFKEQLWFWSYLANFKWFFYNGEIASFIVLAHLWSLAIEEQFYLCWPFLISGFHLKKIKKVLLGIFCFSFLVRVLLYAAGHSDWHIKVFFFARIDMLAAGAWLALLYHEKKLHFENKHIIFNLLSVLLSSIAVYLFFSTFFHNLPVFKAFRWTFIWCCLGLFLIAVLLSPSGSFLNRTLTSRLLVLTGKYSYSMYLVQSGIVLLFLHFLLPHLSTYIHSATLIWITLFLLSAAVSFGIGWFTYRFFERFFLNLKDVIAPLELSSDDSQEKGNDGLEIAKGKDG